MGNSLLKSDRSSIKFLHIILLFLLACDSEENVEPNELDPSKDWTSCLLARIDGSEASAIYKYNADGQLTSHITRPLNADSIVSTIEYENDNIVRISQPLGYIEYKYDTDNKVIASSIFARRKVEEIFSKLFDFVYTYNENNQMDSTIIVGFGYRRYEYNDQGYLISSYYKDGSSPEKPGSQVLEYDDKKVPESSYFSHFFAGWDVDLLIIRLPLAGPHNVKKSKIWLVDGSTETRQYSFTYNTLGYPISATETGGLLGPTNVTLLYSCK